MKNINELLKNLHIHPNQISLFETAFTHPSYNGEAKTQHHDYERLEFMGDSIVNFVVADLIFRNFPNRQEGDMTKIRASLVRGESLAKHARALHLGDYILLSHGLQLNGGSDSSKVLENVFEAFMGATYMDQGFDFTYQLLRSLFIVDIQNFDESTMVDYKTSLQEEMQMDRRGVVQYKIVEQSGPAHAPIFVAEVYFNCLCLGRGHASTKKEAEQLAAKDALSKKAG